MHKLVQQHLLRAQDRMKKQADKIRYERQFAVGDLVYLKLQPYIQSNTSGKLLITWSSLLRPQFILCFTCLS